jgi:hypothetical protein
MADTDLGEKKVPTSGAWNALLRGIGNNLSWILNPHVILGLSAFVTWGLLVILKGAPMGPFVTVLKASVIGLAVSAAKGPSKQ